MTYKYKILHADGEFLIREGMKAIIGDLNEFSLVGEAESGDAMIKQAKRLVPDLIISDYQPDLFSAAHFNEILTVLPQTQILVISAVRERSRIVEALDTGVKGYLLKDCDRQEITDAIKALVRKDKFMCGQVLDEIANGDNEAAVERQNSCRPIQISNRESEVVSLIAQGLMNKQIAEKLHLSVHTVITHRKNIMNKLKIKTVPELTIYAIRNKLIKLDEVSV